jgi:hypothetical protein
MKTKKKITLKRKQAIYSTIECLPSGWESELYNKSTVKEKDVVDCLEALYASKKAEENTMIDEMFKYYEEGQ